LRARQMAGPVGKGAQGRRWIETPSLCPPYG
jgi:hypothetical protein